MCEKKKTESIADTIDRKVHEAIVDVFRAAKGEPCLECDKRQELINCKDAEIAELKARLPETVSERQARLQREGVGL